MPISENHSIFANYYLHRTNIAQARLNSFNQDLNLREGDYQVSLYQPPRSRA